MCVREKLFSMRLNLNATRNRENWACAICCFQALSSECRTKTMATRRRRSVSSRGSFRDDPQLQQYFLDGVNPTGKVLGVGSYGSVVEVSIEYLDKLAKGGAREGEQHFIHKFLLAF